MLSIHPRPKVRYPHLCVRYCQCKIQNNASAKKPIACNDCATIQIGTQEGGVFITIKISKQEDFLIFLNFICTEFVPHLTALELLLEIKSDLAIHLPYGEIDHATICYLTDAVEVSLVFKDRRISLLPPTSYTIKYQFKL